MLSIKTANVQQSNRLRCKFCFSVDSYGHTLKANLSCTRKKSNSSDTKKFACVYIFLFSDKSWTSGTQVWVLSGEFGVGQRINLQLIGEISLELDSNSSWHLEYGCYCFTSRGQGIDLRSKNRKFILAFQAPSKNGEVRRSTPHGQGRRQKNFQGEGGATEKKTEK